MKHTELFLCECDSPEHQFIVRYWVDAKEVYVDIHLTKATFWKRVWYAIKYIFGYQCKYGAFDEIILNPDDAERLQKVVDHLRKCVFPGFEDMGVPGKDFVPVDWVETLEKYGKWKIVQAKEEKEASKATEAVERIDKYIDEHLANAHDMKDSDPDKKYYRGWDDALGKMSGILQDVYSGEKQEEQKPLTADEYRKRFDELYENHPWYMQKPAEWSEEDEKMLNDIIGILHSTEDAALANFSEQKKWLKSLPERFTLTSKQEWSEEDEEMKSLVFRTVNGLYNWTRYMGDDCEEAKKAVDWVRNLSPCSQPKQEWDKFDEECLKRAAWYVENPAPSVVKDTNLALWLRSLPERFNPQPKPEWNEEDIKKIRSEEYTKGFNDAAFGSKQEWNKEDEENLQTRFAFYTYKDDPCTLYLSNVFVEEISRNKGFGAKILTAAEKVAETLGITYIRLKVKRDNPANAWYRKNGYNYMTSEDGYDWLEKNLEYLKSNKLEWSEEDEEMKSLVFRIVNGLYNLTRYIGDDCEKAKKAVDWVRDLSPLSQPKLEWSEEDEKHYVDALTGLRYSYEDLSNHKSFGSAEDVKRAFDWLKSLPQRVTR